MGDTGGGWLVTYQHDPIDEENLREVRLAIMQSQFDAEWGAYAVCAQGRGWHGMMERR